MVATARVPAPPHNMEAEQSVLGSLLLKAAALSDVLEVLEAGDFYYPSHQAIFLAIQDLAAAGQPVDLVSVAKRLMSQARLEQAGGPAYLADLADSVLGGANALHHAGLVRDKAVLRRLLQAAYATMEAAGAPGADPQEALDAAQASVLDVTLGRGRGGLVAAGSLLAGQMEALQRRFESGQVASGVPTGYAGLDTLTGGLQPTDFIIIAGRPAMGKTAFALNVALRAAAGGKQVAVFSLEMGQDQLVERLLSVAGKVPLGAIRKGRLNEEAWVKLHQACDVLNSSGLHLDDTPSLSVMELRSRCRRMLASGGLDLVVVNYLQLMRPGKRSDVREQEIADISRNLKGLAKELNVPVVALSQLNRKLEERGDKRPMLSDLRESGAIEQDADVILFLYRDEVYNKRDDNPERGKAEVILGKQRNGPTGTVELAYVAACTAFEELENRL